MWTHGGDTTQQASVAWGIIKTLKQDHHRLLGLLGNKDKKNGETLFWDYLRSSVNPIQCSKGKGV